MFSIPDVFISDLDGTLFKSGTDQVSPEDLHAVAGWKKSGREFWVATGRGKNTMLHLKMLGIEPDVLVCSAGAAFQIRNKEVQYLGRISRSLALSVFDFLDQTFPDLDYMLDLTDSAQHYARMGAGLFSERFGKESGIIRAPHSYTDDREAVLLRIFCLGPSDEYVNCAGQKVEERFKGELKCYHTDKNCIDIMPFNCNKWNAIEKILEMQNRSSDSAAAIGDEIADIEMLKKCGTGFAMAGAGKEVKDSADFTVSSVKEAISFLTSEIDCADGS